MTKKLVFANLISTDFNDFQFDTNKSVGSVELQQIYGVPRTDKVTTPLEVYLAKRLRKDLNSLKADLIHAIADSKFRKEFTSIADTKYRLRSYNKFSNGQKLIHRQFNAVRSIVLAAIIFDEDWVYIDYFSSINGIPILYHALKISEIKQWMRKDKVKDIFND